MNPRTFPKLFIASILMIFISSKSIAQSATLTVNQDSKLTLLLELKKELEKGREFSDGYTIQLYYGELDKANQTVRKYKGNYGNYPASIYYETPIYNVCAGDFSSLMEAVRTLIEIQKSF
mgnify:CR=1 FL=1